MLLSGTAQCYAAEAPENMLISCLNKTAAADVCVLEEGSAGNNLIYAIQIFKSTVIHAYCWSILPGELNYR